MKTLKDKWYIVKGLQVAIFIILSVDRLHQLWLAYANRLYQLWVWVHA